MRLNSIANVVTIAVSLQCIEQLVGVLAAHVAAEQRRAQGTGKQVALLQALLTVHAANTVGGDDQLVLGQEISHHGRVPASILDVNFP